MKRSILTISDDFNSPALPDGTRKAAIHSLLLQEEIIAGHVNAGDPLFVFFDPYDENGEGFGITGTVVSCTISFNMEGERWVWVTYRDDFDLDS